MSHETPFLSQESLSLWMTLGRTEIKPIEIKRLSSDQNFDVCVIGGGISGITTAYLLQKEGKRVCVLESKEIGSGQTGRTTAHLATMLNNRYYVLEKFHGELGAKMAAESHLEALNRVEQIVTEEEIQCELERLDGYLFLGPHQSEDILNRELDSTQRAGLSDVYMVNRSPLRSFNTGAALCFPRQLQLHPLKYLYGLAHAFLKMGGEIFSYTHVKDMIGGPSAIVMTESGYKVRCKAIVVATHSPINDVFAIHTKQAPYRTYVIGIEVPKNSVAKGLYWDTLDPYHYVRIEEAQEDSEFDLLIVGGEDHKTGQNDQPEQNYLKLESWVRERFPTAKKILYRWSGQILETIDGLGFLGHNPMDRNNVYVLTGDSGDGFTHATIGGILITDQIMGRINPWEQLYQPSRISLRAIQTYVKENINVVMQYADWFMEDRVEEMEVLPSGEGAVFRKGLKVLAAYRSPEGKLKVLSANCSHLGGIVRWNSAEKSWDCPCHGSRFDCEGRVLEGPAVSDLKPVDIPRTRRPIPNSPTRVNPSVSISPSHWATGANREKMQNPEP